MRRPLLINSSLLILASLLAGMVWLSLKQQNKESKVPLTTLSPDHVSLIAIENHSGLTIRLERKSTGWMMTQPSMGVADDAVINDLLEITQTRSIRRFQAPQDLTAYGLNPPQAVLTMNQTRIEMGGAHPMNQRRYMRVGDMIHLINDRFPHLLQAPPDHYIATKSP